MARYFAGTSLASFSRTNVAATETTNASFIDTRAVSRGVLTDAGSLSTPDFLATGTVWVGFDQYPGSAAGVAYATLYNGSTPIFRLWRVLTATWRVDYWNGTAWVTGTNFTGPDSSRGRWTFKVALNSGIDVYLAGTLVYSGSGWTGGETQATRLVLSGAGSGNAFSQVMIADYDIRDSRYTDRALNGDSAANTGGSGAYTAIQETGLDESTAVKVATSGNKQGQTKAGLTVPAGYIIGAMVVNGRGRVSGTITDGKLGVRTGTGTNSSGSGLGYTGGYEPRSRVIETNPDTATNWTESEFNAAEIYEEAV